MLPTGMLAALVWTLRPGAWRLAASWMSLLLVAMLLTLASKLAFIGWGLGYAMLDYTGVSGHAMMSAAVCPLTLAAMVPARSWPGRWGAAGVGVGLALLVGVSRVFVGAHSWSEVLAGCFLGMGVTTWVVWRHGLPRARPSRSPVATWLVPAVVMVSVVAVIVWSTSFSTHRIVTRLSLALSGHAKPYTRADLLRRSARPHRQRRPAGSAHSLAADVQWHAGGEQADAVPIARAVLGQPHALHLRVVQGMGLTLASPWHLLHFAHPLQTCATPDPRVGCKTRPWRRLPGFGGARHAPQDGRSTSGP